MPSTNNYIEEFFISIGFDTNKVKKQAKEIDKVLNGLEKRKSSAVSKEVNEKQKLYKLQRQSEADNFKFFLKQEKDKQKAIEATSRVRKQQLAQESLKRERIDNMAEGIRTGGAYRRLQATGKMGDFDSRINKAVAEQNATALKRLKREITSTTTATRGLQRQMMGLATVQGGLTDSTRNMIRSYASVFALFQGTNAIKKVGQDFQGIEASMLAVSGSAPAAAEDMQFLNSVVDEMGLNLKDTTDAYVKFKFAAKGKMGQTEIEDLFTNISMFGTALKVAPEDMKRAQRALSQMMSKGRVMSEEFCKIDSFCRNAE